MRGPMIGDIIRWWRSEVAGLTQRDLADRIGRAPSAISAWESSHTHPSVSLAALDTAMGADGALASLLWSAKTPQELAPRRTWTHIAREPRTTTWIWLRSQPGADIEIEWEWGISSVRAVLSPDVYGVILTVPLHMPEQPLVVHLSPPGWVDFGRGELPRRPPGIRVIDARTLVTPVAYDSVALGDLLPGSTLTPDALPAPILTEGHPARRLLSFAIRATRLSGRRHPEPVPPLLTPRPVGTDPMAAFRRARGLSYRSLSERLARELGVTASADTLRRLEQGLAQARDQRLEGAVDQVLGADGRLCSGEIRRAVHGPGTVQFPPFWSGPVWLEFPHVDGPTPVALRWGGWQKDLRLTGPSAVRTHCVTPQEPLRVDISRRSRWSAGLGWWDEAHPVDRNWIPTTAERAMIVRDYAIAQLEATFEIKRGSIRRWTQRR